MYHVSNLFESEDREEANKLGRFKIFVPLCMINT